MIRNKKTLNRAITIALLLCLVVGVIYYKTHPKQQVKAPDIIKEKEEIKIHTPSESQKEEDKPFDVALSSDDKWVLTNPESLMALVNKERNLPSDYVPENLVMANPSIVQYLSTGELDKNKVRGDVEQPLVEMMSAAKNDGVIICFASAYRSYERQKNVFSYNEQEKGYDEANQVSAVPGQSEHQTGLAIDFTASSVNFSLVEDFENTVEGQWLYNNAYKYGFILRYPKDKTDITGYTYEPWHYRYVGKDTAKEIHEKGLTLEEYYKEVLLK